MLTYDWPVFLYCRHMQMIPPWTMGNVLSNFFKVCVCIKFLLCNILPEFGMTCMKYVQNTVWREHLCALQVFLCALVSRPVCARTCAQFRGNIDNGDPSTAGGDCS